MNFSIQFSKRDFSGPVAAGAVRLGVERLDWRAVGGPWSARLRADAQNAAGLWGLVELLRCGVTITDPRGPAWWGYVSAVELHDGARVLRISLDEMGNKVSTGYADFAGVRAVTGWASDADSIRVFGEKERMFQLKSSNASDATAYAAAMLARVSRPVSSARLGEDTKGLYAIIEARGWWSSLDWKFYHETRGQLGWIRGGSIQNWGHDATMQQCNWSITVPAGVDAWSVSEVWVKLRRFRAADAVTCKLQSTAGGWPNANIITSVLPASSIPDEMGWVRFGFASPAVLTPGVLYFLGLERAGAVDANAYYTISVDEGLGNAGSALYHWGSGGYISRTPAADMVFQAIGVEETTEQVRRLLAGGQFISGVRIESPSGIQTQMFQSGSLRAQARAEDLLKLGTSAGGRLLARVEPDRTARVFAAPAGLVSGGAGLVFGHNGQVRRGDGRGLDPSEWPAGQWVGLGPLAGAVGNLVNGASVFVEGCTWSPAAGMRISQV